MPQAYFIHKAYFILRSNISPVTKGTDIIVKNLFCQTDKRDFLHGAPDRGRTCTSKIPDPKSGASANSATGAIAN